MHRQNQLHILMISRLGQYIKACVAKCMPSLPSDASGTLPGATLRLAFHFLAAAMPA